MPWYINILVGIIIGGIIFNAKMRRSFMGLLDGFMSKKTPKKAKPKGRKSVVIEGKRYRLEEDE